MTSSSYFLSTIFSSNERLASDKSPASARRSSRGTIKDKHTGAYFLDPPKWPVECQVLPQKIFHMCTIPSKPEPFYIPSGTEPQPRPVGEEMGTVIYDYQPKLSVDYYCHSTTSVGTEVLQTFETDENTLRFESRFECGNLSKVIKITNVYYELYLRPDMYTERHSQWYYFRIQNMKEGVLYRFSIVNLNKPESLYRYGLKPLMYSEKNAQINGVGWTRCGKNISYFKNDLTSDENGSYYTLTFNLKFKHNEDTVYIAHCYPYSYTNLQNHLRRIEMDRFKMTVCQTRLLCHTLAGNNIYILTISSPETITADEDDEANKKPVVFLTARVHPGETPSSYMMKEIIDFLTSDCPQAQILRDRFIFKIIPMLNADGVIVGNSRCCLLGQDLNRQYGTVLREAFPQIYHTKVILRRLAEENRLFLYCDIHGHSRKNNAFIYGCENRKMSERKLTEQVFPLMMHKNASDKFSFQSCKFKVQKSKEGTGRLFVWTLGVNNSYTIEVSLGGSTLSSRQQTHFHIGDYEGLGRHFCETLLDYSDPSKEQMRERILQKLIDKGSTADEPINVPISDYSSLSHSESENEQQLNDTVEDEGGEDKLLVARTIQRQASVRIKSKHNRSSRKLKMVLNVSKASVEFIGLERMHKSSIAVDDDDEEFVTNTIKHTDVANYEATNKRHKLRRQESILAAMEKKRILRSGASFRKYSKVVFDDPFNPPDPDASITVVRSTKKRIGIHQKSYDVEMPQSEDECDQTENTETLVAQLSQQISTLRLSKSSHRLDTEPPQIKIKSPIPARVDTNRKHINRSKSQRVDESSVGKLSPSTSMNRLSVPKAFQYQQQQRRVSWSGATSLAIPSHPSSASGVNSDSSISHRRSSVQRIGEYVKTSTKGVRKSISVGGSRTTSTEETTTVKSESAISEIKTQVTSTTASSSTSTATATITASRRRKLQHTKKHRSLKKKL